MENQNIDIELVNRIAEAVKQRMLLPVESSVVKLSAFYSEFDIVELARKTEEIFNSPPSVLELEFLKKNSYYISLRNTYAVDDYYRNLVLQKMDQQEIIRLADTILSNSKDITESLFYKFINGNPPVLAKMKLDELVATSKIIKWCRDTVINVLDEEAVIRQIRQEELLIPFKRLISNFKGRNTELKTLDDFVKWAPKKGLWNYIKRKVGYSYKLAIKLPLFITGIGGTGKSTLIAKSIIDHIEFNGAAKTPFIYIDFDRPGFSIASIFSLAKEALRQLAIQYDNYKQVFEKITALIDSEYGTKTLESDSRASDRKYLYEQVFSSENVYLLSKLDTTLLLVFDSFEELQYRAKSTDIENLLNFLNEITEYIPQIRPIFIGRSEFNSPSYKFQDLRLPGFDQLSASGFLESQGITDPDLQDSICSQFGYNPLTLRLASNLVVKDFKGQKITLNEVKARGLFAKIDKNLIQEELVTRNLDHIHSNDENVKKIAIPGILVRKINADVVQHVLAEVCGLGKISTDTASALFHELKKESFLFVYNGENISFRQDLRISLRDLVGKNHSYNGNGVHDAAVAFYTGKEAVEDKAELLYHSLMRGDDPSVIDREYTPEMRDFIISSLIELPGRAYLHFSRVLGLTIPEEKLNNIDIADWEAYMKMQIDGVFSNGDEPLLTNLYKQLLARKDRSPQKSLSFEEAKVYLRLSDFAKAEELISSRPTVSKSEFDWQRALKTATLEAEIHEYQFDFISASKSLYSVAIELVNLKFPSEILVDYYFTLIRNERRLGMTLNQLSYKELIKNLKALTSSKVSGDKIFDLIPMPYNILWRQMYSKTEKNETEFDFIKVQVEYYFEKLEPSETFQSGYENLRKDLKSNIDLEIFLKRNFDIYLKDISLPGIHYINLYDALKFIELHPEKSYAKIFSSSAKFANVKNEIQADDFISHPEIKRLMQRLEGSFSSDRPFIVSDVIDKSGYQYVNLAQGGAGVNVFALVGYTYILEQMGIRFLHLSGTGSGVLNTTLHAIAGNKHEAKSTKILEILSSLNFLRLIDGPPLARWIFKRFISNNFFLNIKAILLYFGVSFLVFAAISIESYYLGSFTSYVILSFTITYIFLICLLLIYIPRVINKANTGYGLNRGYLLRDWVKLMFHEFNIKTVSDLRSKASESIEGLQLRNSRSAGIEGLSPSVSITATEVVTQTNIHFPEMAELFRINRDIDTLHPADFIRAAMSVPFLYDSFTIRNIPREAEEIKRAWLEIAGETMPPTTAYFIDATITNSLFNEVIRNADKEFTRLPSFGICIDDTYENTENNSHDNGLPLFFMRLVNVRRGNDKTNEIAFKAYRKGIGRISLLQYNWLNYFLTDEDKINIFVIGAQTATEFLMSFDWEEYKTLINETNAKSPS